MAEALNFVPVLSRLDLVSTSVAACVREWHGSVPVKDLWVAEIDPESAGGADFCTRYGFKFSEGANCVVVEGKRGATRIMAAVLVPVGCRTDFNGVVRKHLDVRQVSLASKELVLAETNMEYGSITVVGLPQSWPILIDEAIATAARIVIGSGLKRSKLSFPGPAFLDLKNAKMIIGLAKPPMTE